MTIHITGDIHGDITRLINYKKTKAGDIVIIAGDFGLFWSKKTTDIKLKALEELGAERGID